jgi:O-antigen ligase
MIVLRAARLLTVALVAWGAFAFGGVYPWAYWPLAAGAALVGFWGVIDGLAWNDPRARRLAFALGVLVLAAALQVVPLPVSWTTVLSPGFDRFFAQYRLGYTPPSAGWRALSLVPENTVVVIVVLACFSLLLVGLTRTVRRMGIDWIATELMGIGVALAVFGVVQRSLLGADPSHALVYGLWAPIEGGQVFGPFINRNHFAGWMTMTLPVVIGYSCGLARQVDRPATRGWRGWLQWGSTVEASRLMVVGVSILVMGMSLALTGSRSGLAAFAIAAAVLMLFVAHRTRAAVRRAVVGGYLVLLLAGAVAWAGADVAMHRFSLAARDLPARVHVWEDTLHIARDFPVTGIGLGSYATAMLIYQTGDRQVMYAQAHNDYVQAAAEGGLLVVIPAIWVVVVLIRQIVHRIHAGEDDPVSGWIRAGAVAGLAGIAAQSFVDFSLQMPGNFVLFVLLVAIAIHRPARRPYAYRV